MHRGRGDSLWGGVTSVGPGGTGCHPTCGRRQPGRCHNLGSILMGTITTVEQGNFVRTICWSPALIGLAGLVSCARGLDTGNLAMQQQRSLSVGVRLLFQLRLHPWTLRASGRKPEREWRAQEGGWRARHDQGSREGRQGAPAGAQSMARTARVVQVTRRLPRRRRGYLHADRRQPGRSWWRASGAGRGAWPRRCGGSPDAPIGSGGTASPDAPITSGPDAPTTLANGSTCTSNGQCTSTYCIDGVCCDKACTGCSACTLQLNGQQGSAKDGQCLPVVASQAPPTTHTPCATDPASPCGLDGLCDGNGACQHTAGGTRCATPSCSGSTLTSSACDSTSHTCTATNSPCSGSQACASATACNTGSCSSDADCVSGYYCVSGTCTKQSGPGVTCSSATECCQGFAWMALLQQCLHGPMPDMRR